MILSDGQAASLSRYIDLLLEANQRLNLTRILDRPSAEVRHIADSLTLLAYLPPGPITLADVGTGGGVPGIPLAIARPDASVTLIEATRKKAAAIGQIVEALGLSNITLLNERAEAVGQSAQRETFDIAVARAVGELVWITEWCLPLVKKGGAVLAMKGPRVSEELPAARKTLHSLAGAEPVVHPVDRPELPGHVIVQIRKMGKSDLRYPRPPTSAKGKPLA